MSSSYFSIVQLALLTLFPGLELRASIPFGILKLGLSWPYVFFLCVFFNALLGPVVYLALRFFVESACKLSFVKTLYSRLILRTRKRVMPYVEKFGFIGIALFVAVPLPGSGSYSGALAAYVLGMNIKDFSIANLLGVVIAGFIVTFLTLSGNYLFLKLV